MNVKKEVQSDMYMISKSCKNGSVLKGITSFHVISEYQAILEILEHINCIVLNMITSAMQKRK